MVVIDIVDQGKANIRFKQTHQNKKVTVNKSILWEWKWTFSIFASLFYNFPQSISMYLKWRLIEAQFGVNLDLS